MRIRALLFIPALAAAALAIGVSSASAATLFTTAQHNVRVTPGATLSATVVGNLDLTAPTGTISNSCTTGNLHIVVGGNNDTNGVDLRVVSGNIDACTLHSVTPTFPWTATITGNSSVSGPNTVWAAAVDGTAFDLGDGLGLFTGNLTTGITASQPTAAATPVTLNLRDAGTVRNHALGVNGFIDGNIRLNGSFSLTN